MSCRRKPASPPTHCRSRTHSCRSMNPPLSGGWMLFFWQPFFPWHDWKKKAQNLLFFFFQFWQELLFFAYFWFFPSDFSESFFGSEKIPNFLISDFSPKPKKKSNFCHFLHIFCIFFIFFIQKMQNEYTWKCKMNIHAYLQIEKFPRLSGQFLYPAPSPSAENVHTRVLPKRILYVTCFLCVYSCLFVFFSRVFLCLFTNSPNKPLFYGAFQHLFLRQLHGRVVTVRHIGGNKLPEWQLPFKLHDLHFFCRIQNLECLKF